MDNLIRKIDLHIHHMDNELTDVVDKMHSTGTTVVALSKLDEDISSILLKQAKSTGRRFIADEAGIVFKDADQDYCIFFATEHNTLFRDTGLVLHLLTWGGGGLQAVPYMDTEALIRRALDAGIIPNLDHPLVANRGTLTMGHITKEEQGYVLEIGKEFGPNAPWELNGYCVPGLRRRLLPVLKVSGRGKNAMYYDVNKEVEGIVAGSEGNLRMIAATDLHARSVGDLNLIGTAHINAVLTGYYPREIRESLRQRIIKGNNDYTNTLRYVPPTHIVKSYASFIVAASLERQLERLRPA